MIKFVFEFLALFYSRVFKNEPALINGLSLNFTRPTRTYTGTHMHTPPSPSSSPKRTLQVEL